MAIGNRVSIKAIKSRKAYTCDLCGDAITAGEHYHLANAQKASRYISRKYCITHSWKDIHAHMREVKEKMEVEQ